MLRRHLLTAAAMLIAAAPAVAASPDTLAMQRGVAWLDRQAITSGGQQADAIVALAASGRAKIDLSARIDALAAVAPGYATTAGAAGKVVLAAVAAGRDPRLLGGTDYVARIRTKYRSGRYGTTAYDQAYAMLGLAAAGESVPSGAIRALRKARGLGGWSFTVAGGTDDVSATGLLMEALRASGVAAADPVIAAPAKWLTAQPNAKGGFNINGGKRATEANSTAIAIRAWRAAGHKPPTAWRVALRSLQETDGGVRFTARNRGSRLLATLDALLAFSGKRLPPPY